MVCVSHNKFILLPRVCFERRGQYMVPRPCLCSGGLGEDFTLPHRFQVESTGLHLDSMSPGGVQVEFLLQAAQPNISLIPPGIHLESTWSPWNPGGVHGFHSIPPT